MLTLHINGWTPPARAIAIAIAEKGLDYELAEHAWRDTPVAFVNFAGQREIANTLEGEFPILVDGDQAFSDSYFVLEYLDERYAHNPLRPSDPYGQWRWQAFARFLGERALPAASSLGVARHFGAGSSARGFAIADLPTAERRAAWLTALTHPADDAVVTESRRKLGLLIERLDKMLGEGSGAWLLGRHFTLSDIAAYVLVDPLLTGALDAVDPTVPNAVRDWHSRAGDRPAVRKATGGRELAFLPGPEHARWG